MEPNCWNYQLLLCWTMLLWSKEGMHMTAKKWQIWFNALGTKVMSNYITWELSAYMKRTTTWHWELNGGQPVRGTSPPKQRPVHTKLLVDMCIPDLFLGQGISCCWPWRRADWIRKDSIRRQKVQSIFKEVSSHSTRSSQQRVADRESEVPHEGVRHVGRVP